ncbi:hypothetical protein [Bacillus marinisedimentorum]|uniref:hypothetical protein n=1 Tax=Bacillus marinisedimentorum TaxID=1821260 RepID=UPI0007E1332C|nr:hypothetical protein [Bacillus marinisedimentorum]
MDQKTLRLLETAGEFARNHLDNKGELPKGKNGPHNHNMTEARNAGHYSILFAFLYHVTGEKKWEGSARLAINKLINLRPLGGSVWHRTEHYKSSYNGLIGQAWSLESLLYCGKALEDSTYWKEAVNIIDQHIFNSDYGLWHELDLDGSARQVGATLNQQIWFMAMALKSDPNSEETNKNAEIFLNKLFKNMIVRKNGLLYSEISGIGNSKLRRIIKKYTMLVRGRNRIQIDAGYHLFTLVGLAMIYQVIPNNSYFSSPLFKKILHYAFSNDYFKLLKESNFAFPYNVPGFEMPFVYTVFENKIDEKLRKAAAEQSLNMFQYQLDNYYQLSNNSINALKTSDTETLLARLYEVYRIDKRFFGGCDE